jgi:hypothetical protein
MAAVLLLPVPDTGAWLGDPAWLRITRLAGLVVLGAGVYALVLLAGGLRPSALARPQDRP